MASDCLAGIRHLPVPGPRHGLRWPHATRSLQPFNIYICTFLKIFLTIFYLETSVPEAITRLSTEAALRWAMQARWAARVPSSAWNYVEGSEKKHI